MSKNIITSAEIGAVIRSHRQALGLSQEQLAEKVGVSYQQVQRYENGMTTLNVENMQRIACALDVSPASFFTAPEVRTAPTQDDPNRTADEKVVLRLFKKLPTAADKKLAISVIRRFSKKLPTK
jgi:transcriptional regulator with XRE-family HTH domain